MKAIETNYQGYRFRSRLEARYAVFLDALGLRWRYEAEGMEFSAGFRYLPDFYLPDWDIYLEVKPDLPQTIVGEGPDGKDVRIFPVIEEGQYTATGKFLLASFELRAVKDNAVQPRLYMACGVPGRPILNRYKGLWKLNDGSVVLHVAGSLDGQPVIPISAWSDSESQGIDFWPYYLSQHGETKPVAYFPDSQCLHIYVGNGRDFASPRLMAAYAAARSARFEHGEQPFPQTPPRPEGN